MPDPIPPDWEYWTPPADVAEVFDESARRAGALAHGFARVGISCKAAAENVGFSFRKLPAGPPRQADDRPATAAAGPVVYPHGQPCAVCASPVPPSPCARRKYCCARCAYAAWERREYPRSRARSARHRAGTVRPFCGFAPVTPEG